MKKILLALFATVGLLSAACTGDTPASSDVSSETAPEATTEQVPEATANSPTEGGIAISLISPNPDAIPMGDAELVVEVTDAATNEPVTVETLNIDLSMAMGDMEPMTTMAIVEPGTEPGQYTVKTNMGMAGMWMMKVESADAAMPGTATFDLEVK